MFNEEEINTVLTLKSQLTLNSKLQIGVDPVPPCFYFSAHG